MSFSFLQRGSLPDYARQLVVTSDEPSLVLEGLVTGIDNLRHDVYLSSKFTEAARQHIFKLVAKHGNVEDMVADDRPASRQHIRHNGHGIGNRIRQSSSGF